MTVENYLLIQEQPGGKFAYNGKGTIENWRNNLGEDPSANSYILSQFEFTSLRGGGTSLVTRVVELAQDSDYEMGSFEPSAPTRLDAQTTDALKSLIPHASSFVPSRQDSKGR